MLVYLIEDDMKLDEGEAHWLKSADEEDNACLDKALHDSAEMDKYDGEL